MIEVTTPEPTTTTEAMTTTEETIVETTPNSTTTPKPSTTSLLTLFPVRDIECKSRKGSHGIQMWPSAKANQFSRAPCPKGFNGTANWLCTMKGVFDPTGPIITCSNVTWIHPFLDKINKTQNLEEIKTVADDVNKNVQNTGM